MSENRQSTEAHVMMPDREAMAQNHVISDAIMATGTKYHIPERIDYPNEGGIYIYYKGLPFPKKGFPYPEAIWSCDIMKRILRFLIQPLGMKELIPAILGFAIMPWKKKSKVLDRLLEEYKRIGHWMLAGHFLKPMRYSRPAGQVAEFAYAFLCHLGLGTAEGPKQGAWASMDSGGNTAWHLARIVATLVEYDDAYRLRISDIASEANEYKIAREPRKEIIRLAGIFSARELSHAKEIVVRGAKVFSYALLIPRIRRAFTSAVRAIDWNKIRLDNADRYHALLRGDYNFVGYTLDARVKIYEDYHRVSKCCGVNVGLMNDVDDGYKCNRCLKPCEVAFNFPPEMELARK